MFNFLGWAKEPGAWQNAFGSLAPGLIMFWIVNRVMIGPRRVAKEYVPELIMVSVVYYFIISGADQIFGELKIGNGLSSFLIIFVFPAILGLAIAFVLSKEWHYIVAEKWAFDWSIPSRMHGTISFVTCQMGRFCS